MLLAVEAQYIADEATAFDYAVAVDELLTALGAEGDMIADDNDRPDSDDTRTLFERLADDPTGSGQRVGMVVMGLVLVARGLRGEGHEAVADDYRNVLLAFVQKIKGDAPVVATEPKAKFTVKNGGEAA